MSKKYYLGANLKQHPKVLAINQATAKAGNRLRELRAEQDSLQAELQQLTEQEKRVRVGSALGEIKGTEVENIEKEIVQVKASLDKLPAEIEAQSEAVKELNRRSKKIYESVYKEQRPKAIKEQGKLIDNLVQALESVIKSNDELQAFHKSCHPNLKIQEKFLILRDSDLSLSGHAGRQSITQIIKTLKGN